jgi:SAM-dependent methyltransferase
MALFDDWPDAYEKWFERPLGKAVLKFELDLVGRLLTPSPGDSLLDAGCGTGIFTSAFLRMGVKVTGMDISLPMLRAARRRQTRRGMSLVQGDMLRLPFRDSAFDHVLSVTALEFLPEAKGALEECFRVVRPGGTVVVATLNRLGMWARKRNRDAKVKDSIFRNTTFRSGEDLLRLAYPRRGACATAVHFTPYEHPLLVRLAPLMEKTGRALSLKTGAFVAARWVKE